MMKPRSEGGEATYQDVLDAPEHQVAEIIDGQLYLSPRPAGPHAVATTKLVAGLVTRFGDDGTPGGWVFLIEPELHFGKNVMVPDIAGWRVERLPDLDVAYFTSPPDWLCETLSPSTERLDRSKKLACHGAAGVRHVWLVNPLMRTLEVYRRHEDAWLLVSSHIDEEVVRAEPFEQVELELKGLWLHLPPPGRASEAPAEYAP